MNLKEMADLKVPDTDLRHFADNIYFKSTHEVCFTVDRNTFGLNSRIETFASAYDKRLHFANSSAKRHVIHPESGEKLYLYFITFPNTLTFGEVMVWFFKLIGWHETAQAFAYQCGPYTEENLEKNGRSKQKQAISNATSISDIEQHLKNIFSSTAPDQTKIRNFIDVLSFFHKESIYDYLKAFVAIQLRQPQHRNLSNYLFISTHYETPYRLTVDLLTCLKNFDEMLKNIDFSYPAEIVLKGDKTWILYLAMRIESLGKFKKDLLEIKFLPLSSDTFTISFPNTFTKADQINLFYEITQQENPLPKEQATSNFISERTIILDENNNNNQSCNTTQPEMPPSKRARTEAHQSPYTTGMTLYQANDTDPFDSKWDESMCENVHYDDNVWLNNPINLDLDDFIDLNHLDEYLNRLNNSNSR